MDGRPALGQALRDAMSRVLSAPGQLLNLAADEAALATALPAAEVLMAYVAPTQPAPPSSWDVQLLPACSEALLLPTDDSSLFSAPPPMSLICQRAGLPNPPSSRCSSAPGFLTKQQVYMLNSLSRPNSEYACHCSP
eukprot:jgi/Tetstr1/442772/TSEL_030857.t1